MKNLEEDLDAQLSKIEAEAKEQARLMYEKEKKELLQRFEEEKAGFAAQLKLYHKVRYDFFLYHCHICKHTHFVFSTDVPRVKEGE